jgi:glutathione S-transferase
MDKFYYTPFGCSLVSHGLMHELGHPHQAIPFVRGAAQHLGDEAFGQLQPARTVPVLETPEGALTQSSLILLHLAERYPSAQLLPTESSARRAALGVLGFLTSDVHPSFRPLFEPQRYVEQPAAVRELRRGATARLSEQLALLEARLAQQPYLNGERFSIADPYVLVFSLWSAHLQVPYPERLAALAQRVAARPGFQRALVIEQAARAAAA